jgi:hypothetical protein
VQKTADYTKWDDKRNEAISDKLKLKRMIDYVENYHRKWKERVNRMNTGRIQKNYQPRGQRRIGCPGKKGEENMRL